MMNLRQALIGAASLIALTVPAVAAETVKIAFIDPLSGGAASTGENGLKHYQYLAEYTTGLGRYYIQVTGAFANGGTYYQLNLYPQPE